MNQGTIHSLRDLMVRVAFDKKMPEIGEILLVDNQAHSWLLVEHLMPGGLAVCLNIKADYSIQRSMKVTPTGRGLEVPVGEATLGRIFDALGQIIDGGAPLPQGTKTKNILRLPAKSDNFTLAKPEILETGIKVIDFFTPFVKGRKVGIIGGAGVGKTVLTMELVHNVAKTGSALGFFAGIGERIREGHELYETLKKRNLLSNTCMFLGQMDQNPVQRAMVGIAAAALAEHFRDEQHKDILFFADNMYRYVQARNELSTILDQVPSEGGYEPTVFSDVKILQDRLSSNENGSITSVQTIYVPADDMSDPGVQMIEHELDSVIVLSRKVAGQGIRPAVDLVQTRSSLLSPDIVGERHYILSVQVQALLQKYESLKNIIAIIGENELSPADRRDYAKAKKLIQHFSQPLHVMEETDGIQGEFVSRASNLKTIEELIV